MRFDSLRGRVDVAGLVIGGALMVAVAGVRGVYRAARGVWYGGNPDHRPTRAEWWR